MLCSQRGVLPVCQVIIKFSNPNVYYNPISSYHLLPYHLLYLVLTKREHCLGAGLTISLFIDHSTIRRIPNRTDRVDYSKGKGLFKKHQRNRDGLLQLVDFFILYSIGVSLKFDLYHFPCF